MTYEYHGITWEVHNVRLPLRIEDFSHVQYEEYSCEWQAETSFLLEHYTASQTPRMDAHTLDIPDLSYEIYRIQVPALYNLCLDQLLDQYKNRLDRSIPEEEQDHFVEVDAEGWGSQVQQVYRLYFGDQPQWKYILCWEEQIVELDVPWSWELTSEQMEIIAEKLSNLSL